MRPSIALAANRAAICIVVEAHITEAIERIQRYTAGLDEAGFVRSQLVQDAVIRNFEIIDLAPLLHVVSALHAQAALGGVAAD